MTDPPIDDTEAREPDAPGTTDAKHRALVHGHTGDVPSHKALSDSTATASRKGSAPCELPCSARGRPSLCTSVSRKPRMRQPEPPGPKPALHSRHERRLAGAAEGPLPRRDSTPEPPGPKPAFHSRQERRFAGAAERDVPPSARLGAVALRTRHRGLGTGSPMTPAAAAGGRTNRMSRAGAWATGLPCLSCMGMRTSDTVAIAIASAPRSLAGMPNRSTRRLSVRSVPRADMTGRQPSAPATASGRAPRW
eukprot:scaffold1447_cov115-Isochrysis_galbana.AAC.3